MQQQLEIIVTFRDKASLQTSKLAKETTKLNTAYQQVEKSAKLASVAQTTMSKNMQQSTRGSANMTMALQSMNFTLRDSPYFFRDFSLGILAVGNNLNPMIDSIIAVKREFGGWRGAMKAFAAQMMGPAGVIMAFSLVVTAIQAITFAMAKNKNASDELGDSYDGLVSAANKYINVIDPRKGLSASLTEEQSKKIINSLKEQISLLEDVDRMVAEAQSTMTGNPAYALGNLLGVGGRDKNEIDAIVEALEKKVGVLEAESIIAKTLAELGVELVDEEKKKKEIKEKQYFLTNEELRAEIERLEVLKSQTIELREQRLYQKQIDDLIQNRFQFESDIALGGAFDLTQNAPTVSKFDDGSSPFALGSPILLGWASKQKEVKKDMQGINMLANTLGNTIYNAFSQGKFAADEFLKSLLAIAVQMTIIEGLKSLFSGGAYSMFSFLSQGGVVKASGGYMTGGNGTHDYIPALLRPREMVLNPNQQAELFHMAKGLGNSGGNQRVDVRLSGGIKVRKNDFVYELEKAKQSYNNAKVI